MYSRSPARQSFLLTQALPRRRPLVAQVQPGTGPPARPPSEQARPPVAAFPGGATPLPARPGPGAASPGGATRSRRFVFAPARPHRRPSAQRESSKVRFCLCPASSRCYCCALDGDCVACGLRRVSLWPPAPLCAVSADDSDGQASSHNTGMHRHLLMSNVIQDRTLQPFNEICFFDVCPNQFDQSLFGC
jgi:hypothetical protein